jgi:hypothetical protein
LQIRRQKPHLNPFVKPTKAYTRRATRTTVRMALTHKQHASCATPLHTSNYKPCNDCGFRVLQFEWVVLMRNTKPKLHPQTHANQCDPGIGESLLAQCTNHRDVTMAIVCATSNDKPRDKCDFSVA